MNVVVGFAVVFSVPYLLSPSYADLGSKTGFIFGGITALGVVWVALCMPELKGRNLEEIDQLFDAKVSAWKMSKFETTGLSHDVAVMGTGHLKAEIAGVSIATDEYVEDVELTGTAQGPRSPEPARPTTGIGARGLKWAFVW